MKIVQHVVVAVTIVVLFGGTMLAVYDRAYELGSREGYAAGFMKALDTRQPSDELEIACAGLWMGEQYKKYEERQHGKR